MVSKWPEDEVCYAWAFGEAITLLLDRKGGLMILDNDIFIVFNTLYIITTLK